MFRLTLLLALLTAPALAQDWPEPGDGFQWERLGDRPIRLRGIDLDGVGRLWGVGPYRVHRLDAPDDPAATWTELGPLPGFDVVDALGMGDTVLVGGFKEIIRTLDAGATWTEVLDYTEAGATFNRLAETTAVGLAGPSGALFAAEDGLWRSLDRGATWTRVPLDDGPDTTPVLDLLPFPADHPRAGGLLAVGFGGAWLADTTASGALTMRPAGRGPALVLEHAALMPSGRVVATGYTTGSGSRFAFYSDDGGASWTDGPALPEPADGIPGDAWLAVVGPAQALAVGGRGVVYATADDGESWSVVGRAPITEDVLTSRELLIDGEGRLLVAVMRAGPDDGEAGVFRTVRPVPVASGSAAPGGAALGVRVVPNPSAGGAVTVELTGEGAARAWVVDALGRRVAEVWAGALRGERRVPLATQGWAPGVYLVVVEGESGRVTHRVTLGR